MSLDFNLTHLRYFCDAARLGSVALAAAHNFVTSSTVSQAIKKLEQSLEVELLHHKKREFRLTNDGNRLLIECERIFLAIKNFETVLQSSKLELSGELKLGSSHSIVSAFLLKTIGEMRETFPLIEPSFKLGRTSTLMKLLQSREIDLVITVDDGTLQQFEIIELYAGQFVVIGDGVSKTKNERYLITETRPETESLREHHKRVHALELPIFLVLDSWELIVQAVESGYGLGLVPDFILNKSIRKSVRRVKKDFGSPCRLVAAHRKGENMSPLAKVFLQLTSVSHIA